MRRVWILAIVAVVAVTVSATLASDVEGADGDPDERWYCYGDTLTLSYPFDDGSEVSWSLELYKTASGTPSVDTRNGNTVELDIKDYERVVATQTVTLGTSTDTEVMEIIPLHLPQSGDEDGVYTVSFYDGSYRLDTQVITRNTVVAVGANHVFVPADLEKEGYTFGGWYTDRECLNPLDPTQPLYGDTDVFAKWTGSSGSGTVIITKPVYINNIHLVTFETSFGLEYRITGTTSDSVSFTVGVVGGFEVVGDISVTAAGIPVSEMDGTYTLSGISSDVTIVINGETHLIGGEESTDVADAGGFPWWILLVIAIAVVIIILVYRYRDRRD